MRPPDVSTRLISALVGLCVCFTVGTSRTFAQTESELTHQQICTLIEREADRNGLPRAFFARLIWKESRFDPGAISPKGAQGIAQFMPATAQRRGLDDSFDPNQALRASATYLAALRLEFGNLGLAAAAYNAGEERIDRWLAGASSLPGETRSYVQDITGESADLFRNRRYQARVLPLEQDTPFRQACLRMASVGNAVVGHSVGLSQPWGVQIAGGYNRVAVIRQWERLKQRHRRILDGLPMALSRQKSPLGAKPIFAVRVGAQSRIEANSICGRLKTEGGHCMVTRN